MDDEHAEAIRDVRRFNRFYTRTIGLLEETLTRSAFTLTEARVLFELAHRTVHLADADGSLAGPAASEIAAQLGLDPAYLTRILRKFAAAGLIAAERDSADRRRQILSLTDPGHSAVAELQRAADEDVGRLVEGLGAEKMRALRRAMATTMDLLREENDGAGRPTLRPHRVGDIGWVVQRQALLYAQEYGWDITFEALLADIGAKFLRDFEEGHDFCWIAEMDGEPMGAVFLVHGEEPGVAKLRMLHVEASARGRGIGKLLVSACIEKARAFGYGRLVLWTNDVLAAARSVYERAGFKLVAEESHFSFGKDLVGQNWELEL